MVERGSTRHSPRVDDELEHEVESLTRGAPVEARADEWRQMEAAAEGEPKPDAVVSVGDVELRSLLATSLRPSAFPAGRDRLVEVACEEQAEDRVVDWLTSLPAAPVYENVQMVWEALGGAPDTREHPLEAFSAPDEAAVPPPSEPAAVAAPARETSEPAERHEAPEERPGESLLDRGVRIALAGAAVAVGLTVEVIRVVLRKR